MENMDRKLFQFTDIITGYRINKVFQIKNVIFWWLTEIHNKKFKYNCDKLLFYICFIVLYVDIVSSQQIHKLVVPPLEAVRIGSNARITCRYQGTDLNEIQYISWTKVFIGGGKAHVYGYDQCNGEDRGYYDLEGRALIDVVNPTTLNHYTNHRRSVETDDSKSGYAFFDGLLPSLFQRGTNDKRTLLSHGRETVRSLEYLETGIKVTSDKDMLVGSATLTIQDVKLEDEARYECLVKPKGGPAETDIQLLTVVVLPTKPSITSPRSLVENRNYSFICNSFVGRPTGALQWFIGTSDGAFKMMPDEQVETRLTHYSNGTSSAESRLFANLTEETHKGVLRCEVSSRAMRHWEKRPNDEAILNVLYAPRNGRILYDSSSRKYYCESVGNPKPTFIWMWVLGDGTKTILSTSPFLDLAPIQSTGIFQFQCLASNVIEGQRHTIVMKTKIKIQGFTTSTTTTTKQPGARNSGGDETSKWSVAIGEPYKIESSEIGHQYDDSKDGAYPLWDIIHGYVGSNPITNSNYNISQISQTLAKAKEVHDIRVQKNSAMSYIEHDVLKPFSIDIKTQRLTDPDEVERTTVYPAESKNNIIGDFSSQKSKVIEVTYEDNKDSREPEGKENIKVSDTELNQMSPENYEYDYSSIDDDDTNDLVGRGEKVKQTSAKSKKIKNVAEVVKKSKSRETTRSRADVVSDVKVVPGFPGMPTVTISELISGRYKKKRPTEKEIADMNPNLIVPWNERGKVDFKTLYKRLPGATKKYIQRRYSKIATKLHRFLHLYRKNKLNSKGKEGKETPEKNEVYFDEIIEEENSKETIADLDNGYNNQNKNMNENIGDLQIKLNNSDEAENYGETVSPDYRYNEEEEETEDQEITDYRENEKPTEDIIHKDLQENTILDDYYDYPNPDIQREVMGENINGIDMLNQRLSTIQNSYNDYSDSTTPLPDDIEMPINTQENKFGILLDNAPHENEVSMKTTPLVNLPVHMPVFQNLFAQNRIPLVPLPVHTNQQIYPPRARVNILRNVLPVPQQRIIFLQNKPPQNIVLPPKQQLLLHPAEQQNLRLYQLPNNLKTLKPPTEYQKQGPMLQQSDFILSNEKETSVEEDRLDQAKQGFLSSQYKTDFNNKQGKPSYTPYKMDGSSPYDNEQETEHSRGQSVKWEPPRYDGPNSSNNDRRVGADDSKDMTVEEDQEKYDKYENVVGGSDKEFDCKTKSNGAFGGGCRAFYRCMDGYTYKVECRAPYVYNQRTEHCDKAENAASPCGDWRDCQNKPNGKYTDLNRECKYYYTCYQGMFLGHNECNPGTVFNEKEQVCDWKNRAPPPCGNG